MEERRAYPRRDIAYKVMYSTAKNPRRRFVARSFNISLGGIGLKIKRFVKNNGPLRLVIYGPDKRMPVEAEGKLVWQSRVPELAEHRAGIQFTDIRWTAIQSLVGEYNVKA